MKKLSLLLALVLILLCSCGLAHEHEFEDFTLTKTPCIVNGEEIATCSCGETLTRAIPATGKHIHENGVCIGCGQNEIALYDVSSSYDADLDGQNDIYYFSPELSNRFENAVRRDQTGSFPPLRHLRGSSDCIVL